MNLASKRNADASKVADKIPTLPSEWDHPAALGGFFMAVPKVFAPGLEPNYRADKTDIPSPRKGH